jgi:hypothetical protein
MHCVACDRILNDFESTRKSEATGEYLDLCSHCYNTIKDDLVVLEREDLCICEDVEDELDWGDVSTEC